MDLELYAKLCWSELPNVGVEGIELWSSCRTAHDLKS